MAQTGGVRVWDPVVRLFHWSLVLSMLITLLLEAGTKLHVIAGYVALGLVGVRVVWGFIGSTHARFSDFVCAPRTVLTYLLQVPGGKAARFLGHNPAGGAMILALLGAVLLAGLTGALLNTDQFWGNKMLEELHEAVAESLFVLVPLHLAGVVLSSLHHRENLVKAMITGWKRTKE